MKLIGVLNEQVGFQELTMKIAQTYPDSVYILRFIEDFIRKSGCKKISVEILTYPASGLSLVDGLTLNERVFSHDFSHFLYVLFHEIAHQYQYTKYGIDKMYGCYTGEIPIREGAEFMKYCENVADDFAFRKIREVKKMFINELKIEVPNMKVYEKAPVEQFERLINLFIKKIKEKGYERKEDISAIIYNYVKSGV